MVCVYVMDMALRRVFMQGGAVVNVTAAYHQVTGSNPTRKACVCFLVVS